MPRPRRGFVLVAASLFLAVAAAGPVRAADRSDAIPVTVGPPGGVGFYVNPDAAGLEPARVQEILVRSLVRWGNTYLGLTTAVPGADDAINVIGVTALPDGLLGLAQTRTPPITRPVPASTVCARTSGETSDTVRRSTRSVRVLLRRDVAVAGTVRRRSVRRTLRVPRFKRVRAALSVRACTLTSATTSTTVARQFDVLLKPSPVSGPWSLGPAFPVSPAFDFETNALHELGHISGLAHQIDECDPSTPMPSDQSPAEYWHAVDEWRRPGCVIPTPPTPPAPAPAVLTGADSSDPLPGVGSKLAGQRILVNPRVPAGYDAARFVAVAERAIRRAGGTPAGLTNAAPVPGDHQTVLGFSGLRDGVLTSWGTVARRQSVPAHTVRSCRVARVRVLRPVVLRRTVSSGGLRLRRDVVQTKVRTVSGFQCTSRRRAARTAGIAPELDVRVNEISVAWELGPRLPADGTRWDLESALLQTLAGASGAPTGGRCDTTTPNSSTGLSPGDWWRSVAEVRRSRCVAGSSNTESPVVALRRAPSSSVPPAAGDGHELPAAGLPYDRPASR
jgi:hypothetical protein